MLTHSLHSSFKLSANCNCPITYGQLLIWPFKQSERGVCDFFLIWLARQISTTTECHSGLPKSQGGFKEFFQKKHICYN